MSHDFAENDPEPLTQSSSSRSGGPPRKHTAAGVLDPRDEPATSARPPRTAFTAFVIVTVLAVMALIVFFLNR
jgi:hypothetical protein